MTLVSGRTISRCWNQRWSW